MAEPLKYMYNPQFFEQLCPILKKHIPMFDEREFIVRVFNNTWPDLELKERVRHLTFVLHHFLPKDFKEAIPLLINLSDDLRNQGLRVQGFEMMFLPDYVEIFGRKDPDLALQALVRITMLVSAEFAIRPFLLHHFDETMHQMIKWSTHENAHVRRLSSEGCRPRLPWAMGIPALKSDPTPILSILENLKNDPSEYVRRSVANNLNDIAKDHPDLVISLAKKWRGKSAETDKIIKHGCRTLLKRGHSHVLNLHRFDPNSKSSISSLSLSGKKIKIGDHLNFGFDFVNRESIPANFRLEYAIDYLTSSGKTSRKVFKITENTLKPGEKVNIRRKQSFKNFTTRKHFKGKHYLTILANGKNLAATEFVVC
jgi:3-methyladenine DNA glycosylase AlkC